MCKANIRSLATSLLMYAADNGGRLPSRAGDEWVLQAVPYVRSLPVAFCPSDTRALRGFALVSRRGEAPGARFGSQLVLEELRRRGLPMTSYLLPTGVAGARPQDLPRGAVLLEERAPGHAGSCWAVRLDCTVVLGPCPESAEVERAVDSSGHPTGGGRGGEPWEAGEATGANWQLPG
jgi:hypothetical protein